MQYNFYQDWIIIAITMGVGAYLIGEGYTSMFLTGVRSFTNVSDYQNVLHQSLMKDPPPQKKIGK